MPVKVSPLFLKIRVKLGGAAASVFFIENWPEFPCVLGHAQQFLLEAMLLVQVIRVHQ